MESWQRRRNVWLGSVTVAFAAAIGVMYILWAAFQPVYFWTSAAAFAVLLALGFVLFRAPRQFAAPEAVAAGTPMAAPEPAPRTGAAPLSVSALQAGQLENPPPVPAAQPPGFVHRGFTLYERTLQTKSGPKTSWYFSKKPQINARPAPLPEGYDVGWDSTKKAPILRPPPGPEPLLRVEAPEPETAAKEGRRCAAWTSPGILCENDVKGDSQYCAKHAHYRPETLFGDVQVRVDGAKGERRAGRLGLPSFDVRQDRPKPVAARGRAHVTKVEVEHDRGEPEKPRHAPRASKIEIEHDHADPQKPRHPPRTTRLEFAQDRPKPQRALGPLTPSRFEVEVDKAEPKPAKRTPRVTRLEVEQDRAEAPKAARSLAPLFNPNKMEVRATRPEAKRAVKPLKGIVAPEPDRVRMDRPKAVKPLKGVAAPEPDRVRMDRPKAVKPLKGVAAPEPDRIRMDRPKAVKPPVLRPTAALDSAAIVVPKGSLAAPARAPKPTRCRALLSSGKQCSNMARPGKAYCASHVSYRPKSEIEVVPDTKRRSTVGLVVASGRGRGKR